MAFDRLEHKGAAVITTLATAITSGDSALDIVDATGWPTGSVGPFYISVFEQSGTVRLNEEKMLVTARTTTNLAGMTRAQDNTTAVDHIAGSVVEHVFAAVEADEANTAAHQTLGLVAAKGDILSGSTANTLVKTAAGANDTVLVADSAQPGGVKFATATSVIGAGDIGTTQLATNAVTTAKITDANVTTAKIATGAVTEAKLSTAFWKRTTFSVTSSASGHVTIPHGASFTPTFVQIMLTAPVGTEASDNAMALGWVILSIDSTNVVIRCGVGNSTTVAGTILTMA